MSNNGMPVESYHDKYLMTIRRILAGYRFSSGIPVCMYAFYADWIHSRNESLWTEDERKYLDLMPELYSSYKVVKKHRGRKKSGDYIRDISDPDYGRHYDLWIYDPDTFEVIRKFVRVREGAEFLNVATLDLAKAANERTIFCGYFVLRHKMHTDDFARLKQIYNKEK